LRNGDFFKLYFYHLPVKSLFFTNLPVNLKAGKSSTLVAAVFWDTWRQYFGELGMAAVFLIIAKMGRRLFI
jgi:hypothetical protein